MATDTVTSGGTHTDGAGGAHEVRIAIVGTGFSGLGAAIRLKQAGIEDFVVLERADDLGGTWRDNHYPGCCCDVPSHLYSYSFELNPLWTRAFAPQWEIWDYLRRTAGKHGVIPHIRYRHEMLDAAWDEDAERWRIETSGGSFTAQMLVLGAGALSNPMIPDYPGIESFEGDAFHSATWDHDHDFSGERVAAIGTGASAIQFVPQVQPRVQQLYLFQRTPPWIIPRWDHQITRWEKLLLTRIPFLPAIVRGLIYAALEMRVLGFRHPRLMRSMGRVARWHLRRQVRDPELRAKLTPDYTIGCKRILISDNYYPSLAQPNVELVTDGIREIRRHSIVATDGTEREVDTILWGTGFYVTEFPIAPRVHGRGGITLADRWRDGPQAHLGVAIAGFPNLFLMTGPNSGLGHTSMVYMIESQLNYILDCVRRLDEQGASTFEVRDDVQDAFNDEVQDSMEGTVWTAEHCKSWYLDANGKNRSLWPNWTFRYRNRTRRFRPAEYELGGGGAPAPRPSTAVAADRR
jgi:cation diffusion facilitator CzcD-associated flavoprotein CzcO